MISQGQKLNKADVLKYCIVLYCIYFIILTGKNTSAMTQYMYIFIAHYVLISQNIFQSACI